MALKRGRPFFIVSEMNDKVLDIKGFDGSAGADVIMYKKKTNRQSAQNQLWYLDDNGYIRTVLNDYALEAKGKGDKFEVEPFNNMPRQHWIFDHDKIVNKHNKDECLDIKGADSGDGVSVVAWDYKGKKNQKWKMEHFND